MSLKHGRNWLYVLCFLNNTIEFYVKLCLQEVADKTARVTELDTEGARLRKDKETSEQNFKRLMERARNLKIENDALKKDKETLTQQNEQQKQVLGM
jgi:hypothetical protein